MDVNAAKGLDYILVKRYITTLTLGLQIKVFEKKLYGESNFYDDKSNLGNTMCLVKSVKGRFFSLPEDEISADLLLGVETRLYHSESFTKYDGFFTYNVKFKLEDGIKKLKILSLEVGDNTRAKNPLTSLSDCLIPDVSPDYYDDIAEEFLSKYYSEVLNTPMPVNVTELLNRMHLDLKRGLLKNTIKGLVAFKDGYVDTIDEDDCIEVHPGTIVINDNISGLEYSGIYNNTVVHECVHWWFHKNFMDLRMLLDKEAGNIVCPSEKELENIEDKAIKVIELQARTLAPLILMPHDTSIIKFDELLFKYSQEQLNAREIYNAAIAEFAGYFGVTVGSAKNRLEKLGYNESLKKDENLKVKSRKTTKFLSYWDYCAVSDNRQLASLLEHRLVIYVDNFIIPNLPELINSDGDEIHLSDYAKKHINDYAMSFDVEWSDQGREVSCYLIHSLYSSGTVTRTMVIPEDAYDKILDIYKNAPESPEKRRFFKYYRTNELNFIDEVTYDKYLHIVMNRHPATVGELAVRTGLSEQLIKKYRSPKGVTYTLDATLRICAALKLYPFESLTLLELMGWDYEGKKSKGIVTKPLEDKYYELITNNYDSGLRVWNEELRKAGFPELKK